MTGLGAAAICGIIGACVTAVSTVVSVSVNVAQANKAERRIKKQELKAEMLMKKKGNMAVIKAMASAAANSTAIRMDKDIASAKLGHLVETNGEGQYKLSKEQAKKAQAKLDQHYQNHNYGSPAMAAVGGSPSGSTSGT